MFNNKIKLKIVISTVFVVVAMNSFISCNNKNVKREGMKIEENEDYKKIDAVMQLMSETFKEQISIDDKEAFLQDLQYVLKIEKTYSSEEEDLYTLVDKKNTIPPTFAPHNIVKIKTNDAYVCNKDNLSLRKEAEEALREMGIAAKQDGIRLSVSSSYRSYDYQDKTFKYWCSIDGEDEAERYSARPGTSQHQLGTAVDFGIIDDSFAETNQSKWLLNNAYKYGWSLSFPKGYEEVTGYKWESWHYRFIGKEACLFQKKWFNDIQQFMLEFINIWKTI